MLPIITPEFIKRWGQLSLIEQLANVGSELNRVLQWQGKNSELATNAAVRTLAFLDLTIADSRWRQSLKELARVREVFCDTVWGEGEHQTPLADLDHYFFQFALAARLNK